MNGFVANQDIPRLGSAVDNKVERRKIREKVSPKLGINRWSVREGAKRNAVFLKDLWVEKFRGLLLSQESCRTCCLADFNEKSG